MYVARVVDDEACSGEPNGDTRSSAFERYDNVTNRAGNAPEFQRTKRKYRVLGRRLLDNIVTYKNRQDEKPELTVELAVSIAKEAFVSAGERDIYTGDCVQRSASNHSAILPSGV